MTKYQFIQSQAALYRFLEEIESVKWIAYDTEFISEGRYQAELCLVQVATEVGNYLLDPLKISDLNPFWERLCDPNATAITHACRSEMEFCYRAIKKFPPNNFDVQIAAAFLGLGYPLSFKTLAAESIGVELEKSETLTDWKRRPLLNSQLEYALDDVRHLHKIASYFHAELERVGRLDWFREETSDYCAELEVAFTEENWRKIVGGKRCSRDELTIIRELWRWRRDKARAKNIVASKILRDDVLLNVAKLKSSDPERLAALRGVSGNLHSHLVVELSRVVESALKLPESQKPKSTVLSYPTYQLATQLTGVLLNQYCALHRIAYPIVTTSFDIRQAIAYHEGKLPKSETARLFTGWRGKFIGSFLEAVLSGKYAMQLSNDLDASPLRLLDVSNASLKNVIEENSLD